MEKGPSMLELVSDSLMLDIKLKRDSVISSCQAVTIPYDTTKFTANLINLIEQGYEDYAVGKYVLDPSSEEFTFLQKLTVDKYVQDSIQQVPIKEYEHFKDFLLSRRSIPRNKLVRYYSRDKKSFDDPSALFATFLLLPLSYRYIKVETEEEIAKCLDFPQLNYNLRADSVSLLSWDNDFAMLYYKYALLQNLYCQLNKSRLNLFDNVFTPTDKPAYMIEPANVKMSEVPLEIKEAPRHDKAKDLLDQLKLDKMKMKHWIPSFESSIQLSQNYLSENWNKGGHNNLSFHMRTAIELDYRSSKNDIVWHNELEDRIGLYSSSEWNSKSELYKISDDQLRILSNFGVRAFKHWYYTFDNEFTTQLFETYNGLGEKKTLQSAPLSPVKFNSGLGMKFSYQTKGKNYGSLYVISANIAPLSFTYMGTERDDINLGRHGLSKDKLDYMNFGSTIKINFKAQFNLDVSWQSRLYFDTSYSSVEMEWENTLNMNVGRYFSTQINVRLRYDDKVEPSPKWNKYLQYNELLSFGFNYKL